MKKKLWTLALAFCLVSAMLPGGVFHAERAWAEDATSTTPTSVKIGGVELNRDKPYYVSGVATNDATQNWTAKFENGTLTLRGLQLTSNNSYAIEAMQGNLTIKLEGENHISRTDSGNVVLVNGDLIISGAGKLTVRDSTNSLNSLIYASGKIEIKEGAVIDAAKTGGSAQTINAHGGNLTVTGSNTSVKAVNHGRVENSDAIRVDLNGGSGNGTVTVSDGATLEAETAATDESAVAINAAWLRVSSGQDYIVRKGDSLANVSEKLAMSVDTSQPAYSRAASSAFKKKAVKVLGPNYLTFTAQVEGSTICFDWYSAEMGSVQTSIDGGKTWNPYTKGSKITLAKVGDKVSFKGKNVITSAHNSERFQMTGKIAASGSVTSLTDGNGNDPNVTIGAQCYYSMFWDCDSLTTAPELPAVKLAAKCYMFMFFDCNNLETAPKLPATSLAESCYEDMFDFCTGLTTAPDLAATEVKKSCYEKMFYNCKSLTKAPDILPAQQLQPRCYASMFQGCVKLQTAPKLPATGLANFCYQLMFNGCVLQATPELSAMTLTDGCYDRMFAACNALTEVPALPATTLANDCYNGMFENCRNLSMRGENNKSDAYTEKWIIPADNADAVKKWNTDMFACDTDKGIYNDVILDGNGSKEPQANVTYYQKGSNSGGETHTHAFNIEKANSEYLKSAATCQAQAVYYKSCTCGAKGTETFAYGEKAPHVADTNKWVYDADQHWRTCIYGCDTVIGDKASHTFSSDGKCTCGYTKGSTVNPTPNPTPSGSSGGGYVAPSTDVKTSGSTDSKVTSSPSTVQNETRTDASGKQETVAKVTVSAANQREILSQAKANKSKRIIIQIAKTAVQGDAKLELNLDKTFVQSILHDTEASLTIRTADGDRVISREALKTLLAQTEGNTVVIDPAAQENPTDPAEPSKAETLAALDSSRLVARSKLVTLKNGRKGIRITWSDRNGAEMNFDGVEIYRSTKKNRFGKKPFYATKGGKSAGYYINSKGIRSGVTYYYKVRGYVLIDGQKHYTDLSLKAIRTVK